MRSIHIDLIDTLPPPRYRPNDLKHTDILTSLKQTRERHQGRVDAMVAHFKEICDKTAPVMRHYFTEKHKSPIAWFAMRLNYIRSVATTSIVGHVLGLGDRHVSNILMDNGTGEVVHIDLGIAFDQVSTPCTSTHHPESLIFYRLQGKLLRVPERVPFRMTRDMVDGMGYSGTQGVFQRCAEETLRVLRERSDVIMTVLEVFKHDPLHSWFVHLLVTIVVVVLRYVSSTRLTPPQDRERTQDQKDSRQYQRARRTRRYGTFTVRVGSWPRSRGERARQRSSRPCTQLCGSQIGQVTQR